MYTRKAKQDGAAKINKVMVEHLFYFALALGLHFPGNRLGSSHPPQFYLGFYFSERAAATVLCLDVCWSRTTDESKETTTHICSQTHTHARTHNKS